MLTRAHVAPFLRVERGVARLAYMADPDGRVVPFLDRLCRLVTRLAGRDRDTVVEALRRQERRVRDVGRLAGISKALLDACEFAPPEGVEFAPAIRDALFRARSSHWPPVPGDAHIPYHIAADRLGRTVDDIERLLYADRPGARVLRRAARLDGRTLLARYNLEPWERSLVSAFRQRVGSGGAGWQLSRETTPVVAGDELFLPDFTLRHADGREALVELVGFWTPEYLEAKARKVAAARLDHLILVVYRGFAVGKALDTLTSSVDMDRVVWFTKQPRAEDVLRAAERCARVWR